MKNQIFGNWWAVAIKGIVVLAFGLFGVTRTDLALPTLIYYFGFLAIFTGISHIIGGIQNESENKKIFYWFLEGSIDIILGLIIILFPEPSAEIMLLFLAAWSFFMGTVQLIYLTKIPKFKIFWSISGLLSILFSLLILKDPFEGAYALTFILGMYFIIYGITLMLLAKKLKYYSKNKIIK